MPEPTRARGRSEHGSALLIEEPPLLILPALAASVGLNEAIVIQQLHYWTQRSTHVHDGHRWVYNTLGQWREQFPFWSAETIKRTMRKLREAGLVVVAQLSADTRDRTNWYRLDYEKLNSLAGVDSPAHEVNLTPSTSGATRPAPSGQPDPMFNVTPETTAETTGRENGAGAPRPSAPPGEPLGFQEWLEHHCEVTGQRMRGPSKARAELARKFGVLIGEGRTLDELKLASIGAHSDKWRRENGHNRPESVLVYAKIDGLIEDGQKAAAKGERPRMVRTKEGDVWDEEL